MPNKNDNDLDFELPEDLNLNSDNDKNIEDPFLKQPSINPVLGVPITDEKSITGMPNLDISRSAKKQNADTQLNNFSQELSKPSDKASTAHLIQSALENVESSHIAPSVSKSKKNSDFSFTTLTSTKKLTSLPLTNIGIIVSLLMATTAIFLSLPSTEQKPDTIFSKTHESKILENNNNIVILKNKILTLENDIAALKARKTRRVVVKKTYPSKKKPSTQYLSPYSKKTISTPYKKK